ncbi:MAG: hypothetical protein IK020_05775 [Clostridiales bacterium]|nr:hypothetical protein [Clostridiales bacterium]
MNRRVSQIRRKKASLSVMMAMLLSLTSCSLGSLPSRTSALDSISDSSVSSSEGSVSQSSSDSGETVELDSREDRLYGYVDGYMSTLCLGDPNLVCESFGVRYSEILPKTYDCDELVFATIFQNLDYYYSAVVTSDYVDYTVDVTCKIPDIRGCVEEILADETFMNEVCRPWLLALTEGDDPTDPSVQAASDEAYTKMKEEILMEALGRITRGEYTEKIMRTDYFSVHNNGGENWICTGFPDVVYLCAKEYYMVSLTYIDLIFEYMLIEKCGNVMVSNGELKQEKLDALLEKKKQEIIDVQQG